GERGAEGVGRRGPRLGRRGSLLPGLRAAPRRAREPHLRGRGPGELMAVVVDNTLDLVREKVEAGERLDFDDGLALLESDDLLALGELADLARRLRGGDGRGFFIPNPYLYQTTSCRRTRELCAFTPTQSEA